MVWGQVNLVAKWLARLIQSIWVETFETRSPYRTTLEAEKVVWGVVIPRMRDGVVLRLVNRKYPWKITEIKFFTESCSMKWEHVERSQKVTLLFFLGFEIIFGLPFFFSYFKNISQLLLANFLLYIIPTCARNGENLAEIKFFTESFSFEMGTSWKKPEGNPVVLFGFRDNFRTPLFSPILKIFLNLCSPIVYFIISLLAPETGRQVSFWNCLRAKYEIPTTLTAGINLVDRLCNLRWTLYSYVHFYMGQNIGL